MLYNVIDEYFLIWFKYNEASISQRYRPHNICLQQDALKI